MILESQLILPNRKATRSNRKMPIRSQFTAPMITSVSEVLSNHFMYFPPLPINTFIITANTGIIHKIMVYCFSYENSTERKELFWLQKKSESVNIRKYKGKRELNIGIFLFVIVLFYLICNACSVFVRRYTFCI